MRLLRRLSVSVGLSVCVASVLTIATVAADGGFGAGAGTFTFTNTFAFASFFNPVDGSTLNFNVDRTTFLFRPRPTGPLQTNVMTQLTVTQFFPPSTENSVCLVIPDADFSVSSNLQTTTLNVTSESTLCPTFSVPMKGALPDGGSGGGGGGGGGGGAGIPVPLTMTATWTGNGVVGASDSNGSFHCLSFSSITHDHTQSALSSNVTETILGIGTMSGGRSNGVFGAVQVSTNVQDVAGLGILPTACGGKGGA